MSFMIVCMCVCVHMRVLFCIDNNVYGDCLCVCACVFSIDNNVRNDCMCVCVRACVQYRY